MRIRNRLAPWVMERRPFAKAIAFLAPARRNARVRHGAVYRVDNGKAPTNGHL